MSYRPRTRLRVRNCKKRCSVCRTIASRFRDVGFMRAWFCAVHFKEQENSNGNSLFWPLVERNAEVGY